MVLEFQLIISKIWEGEEGMTSPVHSQVNQTKRVCALVDVGERLSSSFNPKRVCKSHERITNDNPPTADNPDNGSSLRYRFDELTEIALF